MNNEMTGPERAKLAGVLLGIGGVLNIIYGIAGIGHAKVFASNQHYFFGGLKSWGWAALILGVLELMAAMSLFAAASSDAGSGLSSGRWQPSKRCCSSRPNPCGPWRSSGSGCGSSRA